MVPPVRCLLFLLSVFLFSNKNVVSRVAGVTRHIKPQTRVVGGDKAIPHSAPFMVAIIIDVPNYPEHYALCGGTLISHKYVITAAHCLQGFKIRHVLLGASNRKIEEPEQQKVQAARYFIHDKFGGNSGVGYRHDLAIIELATHVTFDQNIQPVAMPTRRDQRKDYVGEVARVYGWGFIEEEADTIPDVLYYVDVPVISLEECIRQNKRPTMSNRIFKDDLCTSGEKKKGHCHGDSGGPLVLNGTLIGVISRGLSGCERGGPSIYARISNHLKWIKAHTDLGL